MAVKVWYGPIDDGSYHGVILLDAHCDLDRTLGNQVPKLAIIMHQFKRPDGVVVNNPGACWGASGKDAIIVKYMDPSAQPAQFVKQFQIDAASAHPMIWEWRTDKLFAPSAK
jgi:hypothetical protein